jgi:Cof subfamily protein (haloacid dehalogenase superfamily)
VSAESLLPAGYVADLVAADLDGTLIDPDGSFPAGLPQALTSLRTAGVRTVICTGRMFRSARLVAARLGMTAGPVVCYQGAMIADLGGGEPLLHTRMDGRTAAEVVRHVRDLGRHLNAYIDDVLYVDQVTEWARRYARQVEVDIHAVDDLEAEVAARPPTKLVLVTSAADVEAILPGLQERWRGTLYVTRSQAEYIEFVDSSVSKSGALAWLCDRLQIRREAVVALGDGMNDVDMLTWAGRGVAVAEAAPPVRAAADLVVPRAGIPGLIGDLARRAQGERANDGG